MKAVALKHKDSNIDTIKNKLEKEAIKIQKGDEDICRSIGVHGQEIIKDGSTVLTHCNAGRLATSKYGTALAPIYVASDVANKIGSYTLAVFAKRHDIPFYVASPLSTIDMESPDGDSIPIEERDSREITHGFGKQTAPDNVKVYNPTFDVTPHDLVTGIIMEKVLCVLPIMKILKKF